MHDMELVLIEKDQFNFPWHRTKESNLSIY